ncbi:MAG: TetR/AcrR family transcriptional regulator [Salinivenus sp.]
MPPSPDASLSRRERERRTRRRAMLDAARAVFAEKGYADATLNEVAERAEFGKGTLYNYFEGGKEELLFAVFDDTIGELEDLIRTVFHDDRNEQPLRAAFHTFVKGHFEMIREQQDLFLILVKEAHVMAFSDDGERVQFFQEQHERLVNALTPALEAAMENGEIQPLPPASVANLLLANVRGLGTHCTLEKRHCPGEEQRFLNDPAQAADFLTALLFDGLEKNGAATASA